MKSKYRIRQFDNHFQVQQKMWFLFWITEKVVTFDSDPRWIPMRWETLLEAQEYIGECITRNKNSKTKFKKIIKYEK